MIERMVKLGITLMVAGAVAAAGLGLTYTVTRKKIEQYERQVEAKACIEALPGVRSAGEIKEDQALTDKARRKVKDVQKVFRCGERYIVEISSKGYGGPLVLAVGVGADGRVQGVAAITSKETMGLGSKALEPEFTDKFKGITHKDRLVVGEDVQAVTGATITSKAVTREVKEALDAFDQLKK